MNWKFFSGILSLTLCGIFLGMNISLSQAQETTSLKGIMPITFSSGRVGFFNPGDNRMYIYNDNFDECVYIGEITELGQPFKRIQ